MITWFLSIFQWILTVLFSKGPSQESQEAAKASQATQSLDTEERALSELENASNARSTADAQRLRDDTNADHITTDPNASINTNPDGHFRD